MSASTAFIGRVPKHVKTRSGSRFEADEASGRALRPVRRNA
jgi:hypothetical protein